MGTSSPNQEQATPPLLARTGSYLIPRSKKRGTTPTTILKKNILTPTLPSYADRGPYPPFPAWRRAVVRMEFQTELGGFCFDVRVGGRVPSGNMRGPCLPFGQKKVGPSPPGLLKKYFDPYPRVLIMVSHLGLEDNLLTYRKARLQTGPGSAGGSTIS